MRLIYEGTEKAVLVGDKVTLRDGVKAVITYLEKPRHGGSTGRVYVDVIRDDGTSSNRGFFPSVVGAEWIEREDQ